MTHLISFRPNVIASGTAFEAMALIYKYLQKHYDYKFTIIKSEEDEFQDSQLNIISISKKQWKVNPYILSLPIAPLQSRRLAAIFTEADGMLTVDPTVYPQGLAAIQAAAQLRKPIWFDASRTDLSFSQNPGLRLRRKMLKTALRQTTGIIVTVPKCIERFRDLGLFDAAIAPKFTLMGHPVDTARFVPQPKLSEQDGTLRVLVVSRMIPEKGLLYILEAMTPLLLQRKNLQLQFLGSGAMEPLVKQEVEERGLAEKVLFLEPVPHEKLPALLGAADVFVNHAVSLSQWEEFFGAINLEAMACGLPCVVSTSGGIPYAIREENVAQLVEERNVIQLRRAIDQFLQSHEERHRVGQQARDYVERYYALPAIAEKYHRMLQRGFVKLGK